MATFSYRVEDQGSGPMRFMVMYDRLTVDRFDRRRTADYLAAELNAGRCLLAPYEPVGCRIMPQRFV